DQHRDHLDVVDPRLLRRSRRRDRSRRERRPRAPQARGRLLRGRGRVGGRLIALHQLPVPDPLEYAIPCAAAYAVAGSSVRAPPTPWSAALAVAVKRWYRTSSWISASDSERCRSLP